MTKATSRLVSPPTENRTVTPRRKANTAYRPREHLTEAEVGRLIKAAKNNRWGLRDSAMILIAFRHGLRVSELVHLQWSAVESRARSCMSGDPGRCRGHPYLAGDEMRVLRVLRRESQGAFLFVSERGAPFIRPGSQNSWSESAKPLRCPLRSTRTNCGMPAVLVGQSRCRYADTPSLFRSSVDQQHDTLRGLGAGPVREFVALITKGTVR